MQIAALRRTVDALTQNVYTLQKNANVAKQKIDTLRQKLQNPAAAKLLESEFEESMVLYQHEEADLNTSRLALNVLMEKKARITSLMRYGELMDTIGETNTDIGPLGSIDLMSVEQALESSARANDVVGMLTEQIKDSLQANEQVHQHNQRTSRFDVHKMGVPFPELTDSFSENIAITVTAPDTANDANESMLAQKQLQHNNPPVAPFLPRIIPVDNIL